MKDIATYMNPILGGDYPDPSIIRVGEDYFMTHSSFDYVPGLLVWHSRNLTHWRPVGHALNQYVGSVWAPDLVKHGDTFHIYFPAAPTNWVITARSPEGPWSFPVDLKVGRFDPGHIVGADGRRYLHLSGGHLVELSRDGLSTIGNVRKIYDGWTIPSEWRIEGDCLEGPKLTVKNGIYYLVSAMGGTAGPSTSHMVVVARSKNPDGPWENSPHNPLVHTAGHDDRWWSCGHGTLIDTPDGQWYCMYHAYENGFRTLGRQTLLEPVEWTSEGWPVSRKGTDRAKPIAKALGTCVPSGIDLSDDFSQPNLNVQWRFWKNCDRSRYEVGDGRLILKATGGSVKDSSPLACIPAHHSCEAALDVEVSDGCEAGLVLFYNSDSCAGIIFSRGKVYVLKHGRKSREMPVSGARVRLRLVNDRHEVDLFVTPESGKEVKMRESLEVSGYHHNVFGGFLGLRLALFAFGNGQAIFRRFRYRQVQSRGRK